MHFTPIFKLQLINIVFLIYNQYIKGCAPDVLTLFFQITTKTTDKERIQ